MVGLPDLVRPFGLTPINQVLSFAIGLFAAQGQGLQIPGDGTGHLVDRVISRRLFPARLRDAANLPINGTRAKWRALQGKAFGKTEQIFGDMPFALI